MITPIFNPGDQQTLPSKGDVPVGSRRLAWAWFILSGGVILLGTAAIGFREWIVGSILVFAGTIGVWPMLSEQRMLRRMRERTRR